jgi:hypothetical protein
MWWEVQERLEFVNLHVYKDSFFGYHVDLMI